MNSLISLIMMTTQRISATIANVLIVSQADQRTHELSSQPFISATWYHVLLLLFSTTLYIPLHAHDILLINIILTNSPFYMLLYVHGNTFTSSIRADLAPVCPNDLPSVRQLRPCSFVHIASYDWNIYTL